MKTQEALKLVGGLSKPSKMPGWAYGIPAKECKTGKKLQNIEGSTCYGCYALKGCYVFKVVQDAQYRRLNSIRHPHTGFELWFTCCNLKNQNTLDGTTLVMCRTSSI
jgi:hypothetical protein